MSTDQTAELLFTIASISSFPTIIMNIFLIAWIFYEHMDRKLESITIWSVAAITFLSGCCVSVAWYCWHIQTYTFATDVICGSAIFICWQAGTGSIYYIFIKRLHRTFNQTKYDITTNIYTALTCGCIFFFVIQIILLITWYYSMIYYISTNTLHIIVAVTVIVEQLLDFLLSVSFLMIFIKKLRALNIDIGLNYLSYDLELNDMKSVQNSTLNKQQLVIIKSLSKITILSCIAIISTQCFFIYEGILYWLDAPLRLNAIRYIAMSLDCMINSICVILNFDFADGWYISLCKSCDCCLTTICTYDAIKKQNNLKQQLLQ
eukprot:224754_1